MASSPSWTQRAAPKVGKRPEPVETRQMAAPPTVRSAFMLGNMMRPSSAYDAARVTGPRAIHRPEFGPAEAVMGPLDRLRGACQDQARNNPIAGKGLLSAATNVVSDGFRVRTPYSDLQRLWNDWQDEALTSGRMDFNGAQFALVHAAMQDGDSFFRLRERRDGDMRTVPLQLQLYEGAQVPSGYHEQDPGNGIETIAGVQFDALGRRRGYFMLPKHPGDRRSWTGVGSWNPQWVTGEDVHQVMMPRRLDLDVRGEPWLARVLVKLQDLMNYDENEVIRKASTTQWGGFIKLSSEMNARMGQDIFPMSTAQGGGGGIIDVTPGSFPVLPPGYEVQYSQPVDVGGQYEPFMRMQLMLVAAGLGITYEQLIGEWGRGANDRQYRASMLEFVRLLKVWQGTMVVQQMVKPVWRRFVVLAYTSGMWLPPANSDPLDWFQCEIAAPARGYINPLQEVEMYERAVNAGFMSRTRVAELNGIEAMTLDIENAKDALRMAANGLTYTTHTNPMVANFDPAITEALRQQVVREVARAVERMREDNTDATSFGGDGDD